MKQTRTGTMVMATCFTFSALMSIQAMAQPALGSLATAGGGGGGDMLGGSFSGDSMSSDSGAGGFSQSSAAPQQGSNCASCDAESSQGEPSEQPLPGMEPEGGATAPQGDSESALADSDTPEAGGEGGDATAPQGDSESALADSDTPETGDEGGDATTPQGGSEPAVAESGEQPNRFDGGVTVRQETQGESFTPGEGDFAEARNPSFFERHTVAEDHSSVRTCLAAGEVCQAEFDVIVATSDESEFDSAVLVNDEQVLPPPEE